MMKRILVILTLLTCVIFAQAQYPIQQSVANAPNTIARTNAMRANDGFVNGVFTDTTAANLKQIKAYPGAQIFTTTVPALWLRNAAATAWLQGSGSVDITSFTFLTDSSLIICYGNGVCDTISFNNNNVFLTVNNAFGNCNNLLSGGVVTAANPTVNLIFDVTAAEYTIGCKTYNTALSQVTLANGDATLGRFDVIIVDTFQVVSVLQGTPSSDPQIPQINHASQLALTTFLVPAAATTATQLGITRTVIYDQNLGTPTEWNGAATSWTSDRDDLSFPFNLTKSDLVSGSTVSTSEITWTTTDTMRNGQFDVFKFYIRLTDAWVTGQGLDISFYRGTTKVTNSITFSNNSYGFSQAVTGSYQTIAIPMANWVFTDSIFFKVVIKPLATPFVSQAFRLDWIQLQGGINQALGGSSGLYIWNQYSLAQPANYWIRGAAKVEGGVTSPNTTYPLSERFGLNADARGTAATAVGAYALVTGNTGTAIGDESVSTGGLALGYYARSGGTTNISIGGSTASATSSNLIGRDGLISGTQSFGAGQNVTVAHNNSYVFGYFGASTAASQWVVGATTGNHIVNDFYLGSVGVSGTAATDVTWRISGESGTDQAGHALTIGAGAGTGNAPTGSNIYFQTSDAGASSATLQTLTTKVSLEGSNKGLFLTNARFQVDEGTATAAANSLTLPTDGNLFHITGATQINAITTANWQDGAIVNFIFDAAPLVKNNTAGAGGTATILLAGRVDFQAAAGDYLQLQYDGTNWYETNRALAAAAGGGAPAPPTNSVQYNNAGAFGGSANLLYNASLLTSLSAGLGTTQDDTKGLVMINTTAAAAGLQQISPAIRWSAQGWKTVATAASQEVEFRNYIIPVQGTNNPSATWQLEFAINGGGYDPVLRINSGQAFAFGATSVASAANTIAWMGSTSSGIGAVTFSSNATNAGSNSFIASGQNSVISSGNVGGVLIGTDGTLSALADYAVNGGDANDAFGESSTTFGFGNDNYVQNGMLVGDDNVLGALSAGTGTGNQYTGSFGIGTQLRTTGNNNGTLGYYIQNTGVRSYVMGSGFGTTRLNFGWNNAIGLGTNSDSATVLILPAAGTTGTYGATQLRGTAAIGSVANDNTETKVLVWNAAGVPLEYRDVSTIGGITADNGLTENVANNVQLGGTLTGDTQVDGSTGFQMTFTSAIPSGSSEATLKVINSGLFGIALWATATNGGTGIEASSNTGYGGNISSTSGPGLQVTSTSNTALLTKTNPSSTSTVVETVNSTRETSGTAANGIGQYWSLNTEADDGVVYLSNQLISKFTTAANATRTSQFIITGVNSGTTADKLVIEGDGRIYGTGLHNAAGAVTGTTNQYLASGTYTPGLTNVTNVAASTAYACQWIRVGNVVTVSGKVDIDVTGVGATELGLALPIASAMTAEENLGGDAISAAAASLSAAVRADATNDRAAIVFTATSLTNDSYFFTFTYLIK